MERFRLIFEGLDRHVRVETVMKYMKTGVGLDETSVRRILTRPPGVIITNKTRETVERHRRVLERMGCGLNIEPVSVYPRLSFSISVQDEKTIKKELSKVLRARSLAVLFLVEARPVKPKFLLPSFMGPIRDKIENYFRDSDTVIGIDDRRLAVFCFATGFRGGVTAGKILCKSFTDLFETAVLVSAGYAVFPEQGKSVAELFTLAEMNRKEIIGDSPESRKHCVATQENVMPVKFCFTKARGKAFRRLLTMEANTLWTGLGFLSSPEQQDFLARLPFDSPLIPVLEEMMERNAPPAEDAGGPDPFEKLIDEMELEERILSLEETRNTVLKKLNRVKDLPMLPAIAADIFKFAADPDFSIERLAQLLKTDALVTSRLIQTANSAFYGGMRKINSVKEAIILIGIEKVRDLAFGIAAEKIFDIKPSISSPVIDPAHFWRHSIVTALIAQELCRDMAQYNNAAVFTAGLLHDLGKLFFIEQFPDLYEGIYTDLERREPVFELEEERLGINHAIAGKCLSGRWELPAPVIEAITYHHYPHMAATYSEFAALIGLADYLSYQSLHDDDGQFTGKKGTTGLSYGHVRYLRNIYPSIDQTWLDQMAGRVQKSILDNSELIHVLERGTFHDTAAFRFDKHS